MHHSRMSTFMRSCFCGPCGGYWYDVNPTCWYFSLAVFTTSIVLILIAYPASVGLLALIGSILFLLLVLKWMYELRFPDSFLGRNYYTQREKVDTRNAHIARLRGMTKVQYLAYVQQKNEEGISVQQLASDVGLTLSEWQRDVYGHSWETHSASRSSGSL